MARFTCGFLSALETSRLVGVAKMDLRWIALVEVGGFSFQGVNLP